jgi:hypothetical protein
VLLVKNGCTYFKQWIAGVFSMTKHVTKENGELIERLKAIAKELDVDLADVENPDFSYDSQFENWGWCVPWELRPIWTSLSLDAKLAVAISAKNQWESRMTLCPFP